MSPTFENKDIQGKMTVLIWKNKHLNLIVGPHHMLPQIGSMEFNMQVSQGLMHLQHNAIRSINPKAQDMMMMRNQ